ncbi:MAG: hypothetical protein WBL50_16170 [Candidatus Acidiferrum sp.]
MLQDGTLIYNAIFRLSPVDEVAIYSKTFAEYSSEYSKEYALGYRLYILNVYVLPGDDVRYDAVFRPGTFDRPL